MTKTILVLMFFVSTISHSQIVNIPDPIFKSMLLANVNDINTNGDDQIQISEAEATLSVELNIGPGSTNKIETLQGIEYFVNLHSLEFQNHSVESLDVTMIASLNHLVCDGNEMNTLNVAGLSNLVHLWIMRNNISVLDLTGLDNLEWLWTDDNPITELDISNLTNLDYMWCNSNNLAELDFLPLHNVTRIRCGDNHIDKLEVNHLFGLTELLCEENVIASIDLNGLAALTMFNISDNLISHLDVRQAGVRHLLSSDNPNLTHIIASNGVVSLPNQFDFNNLPQLEYICIDSGEEAAVTSSGYNPLAAVVLGTDCSLSVYENSIGASVNIVPNPVLNSADILSNFYGDSFYIYDVSGKRLLSSEDEAATEAIIESLPSGLYLLTVYNGNTPIRLKFIKN